jgi:hypothetical protein
VLVEPAITRVNWLVFKLGHPEPVDLRADPDGLPSPSKHPFESNQAIPTLLAGRDRRRLERVVQELRLIQRQRLSPFAYPLSGGHRPWCPPARAARRPGHAVRESSDRRAGTAHGLPPAPRDREAVARAHRTVNDFFELHRACLGPWIRGAATYDAGRHADPSNHIAMEF